MTAESIAIICTGVVGVITLLINSYFGNKRLEITLNQARLDREQDRLDRIADRDIILNAGDKRKQEIVKETKQIRAVAVKSALKSEQALRVANGHNEKIEKTIEVAKETLEKLNNPNA